MRAELFIWYHGRIKLSIHGELWNKSSSAHNTKPHMTFMASLNLATSNADCNFLHNMGFHCYSPWTVRKKKTWIHPMKAPPRLWWSPFHPTVRKLAIVQYFEKTTASQNIKLMPAWGQSSVKTAHHSCFGGVVLVCLLQTEGSGLCLHVCGLPL